MFKVLSTFLLLTTASVVLGQVSFDRNVVFDVPIKAIKSVDTYDDWQGMDQKILGFEENGETFTCYRSTPVDPVSIQAFSNVGGNPELELRKYVRIIRREWLQRGCEVDDSVRIELYGEPMISMRFKNKKTGKKRSAIGVLIYEGNLYTFEYDSQQYSERTRKDFLAGIELYQNTQPKAQPQSTNSVSSSDKDENKENEETSMEYLIPLGFVIFLGTLIGILALRARSKRNR